MKLTKKKLVEMIKQELSELTGTAATAKPKLGRGQVSSATKTAKGDEETASKSYDTAKSTYTTRQGETTKASSRGI